jgi:hypothetical protein
MHVPPVADTLDLQAPRTRLGALPLGPPTPILRWTRNQGTRVGGGGSCERRSVLNLDKFTSGVTDLQGPPLMQANRKKIDALKRCTQEIARDWRSRDDVQISYLETLEECDNNNLRLAQMLAR